MRLLPAALLVLVWFGPARAQAPQRTHTVTLDDYFTLALPTEVALAPGGKVVAYAEARWQKSTDDHKADLWVVDGDTGKSRRLTFDRPGVRSLRWSADAREVYYLGQRKRAGETAPPHDGKTQVWRTRIEDGRTIAVTRVPGGIAAFDLDGKTAGLYYVVAVDGKAKGPFRKLKKEMKKIEYGDGQDKFSQVWRLDLDTWRAEKLMDEQHVVRDLAVAPGGKRLALITTPDDTVVSFEGQSRVEVYDTRTKKSAVLPDRAFRAGAPSPHGWLEHLAWSGSGDLLAFSVAFDGYPAEVIVAHHGDEWKTWKLRRPEGVHIRGYGSPLGWRGGNGSPRLYFLGERAGSVSLWAAPIDPEAPGKEQAVNQLGDMAGVVDAFSPAPAEREGVALILGTPSAFREVYLLGKDRKPRCLSRLNPQTDNWKLPKLSVVSWKGAKGDRVEGILELPADAKRGDRLPLVVGLHGGPTSASHHSLQYDIWDGRMYLSARGYAVLYPNYRGSTGYGDRFLTDLIGNENDLDVQDILAGVDALVARKIADPDRLAVMGWSNGGYLTNCVLSKTTRFKAASSGAGIVDTVMQWGANDEPAYMAVLKGGLPWQKPDVYRRTSPTYQLNKVRTPTLIHVGGNDERCPPSHSRMLYRALRLYNKVPAELLVYPGEPHGLTKYGHRRAKMAWDVAWFDRYVLGKKE
jgi:dipeptidyl aminopeptidase/acylaminoacyl peptidase